MKKNPRHTPQEWKKISDDPNLMIAAFHVPMSEVNHWKSLLIKLNDNNNNNKKQPMKNNNNNSKSSSLYIDYENEWELRRQIAWNRWANPLCSGCGKKGSYLKLYKCGRCLLHFYCSKECQMRDWFLGQHQDYCCNKKHIYDGKDPYAPVIGQIKDRNKIKFLLK